MKLTVLIVFTFGLFGCNHKPVLDGEFILKEVITKYDSLNLWGRTKLHIHIQEPRLSNPHRYSILEMDNAINFFKLTRNRGSHISEHIVESNKKSYVLFDGKIATDSVLIKKYRLESFRNMKYKDFYNLLYGLPMSLKHSISEVVNVSEVLFNDKTCYKIEAKLKKAIISRYWNVYVSKCNNRIKGVEIIFPDKPSEGDRIYFEGQITINGVKVPRIRHWHELKDNIYSGTDVIVKEL